MKPLKFTSVVYFLNFRFNKTPTFLLTTIGIRCHPENQSLNQYMLFSGFLLENWSGTLEDNCLINSIYLTRLINSFHLIMPFVQ